MGIRDLTILLLSLPMLVACSTPRFQYRYYGLDLEHGVLLGPKIQDDLRLQTVCTATTLSASPCVVILNDEFFKLKEDYLQMQLRLMSCGKN